MGIRDEEAPANEETAEMLELEQIERAKQKVDKTSRVARANDERRSG